MKAAEFAGRFVRAELYSDRLVLYRNVPGLKSRREVYLANISGIVVKKPSMLYLGYIQFQVTGAENFQHSGIYDVQEFNRNILYDENAISFKSNADYEEALSFAKKVDDLRRPPTHCSPIREHHESAADEPLKFKQLRDAGILVRYFNKPRIDNFLRITIGTDEEMDALCNKMEEIISQ